MFKDIVSHTANNRQDVSYTNIAQNINMYCMAINAIWPVDIRV